MLERIVTFGPLLAGLAALSALILGLTKGTRLRRREELLRSSLEITPEVTEAHAATKQYHRATVAVILSRQIAGQWKFVWPWLAWAAIVALVTNIGYSTIMAVSLNPDGSFYELTYDVLGEGGLAGLVSLFVLLSATTLLVVYQLNRFEDRALLAQEFFSHGTLRLLRPFSYDENQRRLSTPEHPSVRSNQPAIDAAKGRDAESGSAVVSEDLVPSVDSDLTVSTKNSGETSVPQGNDGLARIKHSLGNKLVATRQKISTGLVSVATFVAPGAAVTGIAFLSGTTMAARSLNRAGNAIPSSTNGLIVGVILMTSIATSVAALTITTYKQSFEVRMRTYP